MEDCKAQETTRSAADLGFLMTALLLSLPIPSAAQETLDKGWWVIVANSPQDASPQEMDKAREGVMARLKPCGFRPFNDFSVKFSGFRPGFISYVLGAFPNRAAAEHVKAAVKTCAPTAYVKEAKYAGE